MTTTTHLSAPSNEDLLQLMKVEGADCVSLFVEFSPEHSGKTLTALLKEAQVALTSRHLDAQAVREVLAPVESFETAGNLPIHAGQTLVAYLSRKEHCTFVAPLTIPSKLVVGKRFYVKPVLPLLLTQRRYHVLALSENAARLFRCEGEDCEEVRANSLPTSLKEALSGHDFASSLQGHSSGAAAGQHPMTMHAHSAGVEEVHRNRVLYCQRVSRAIEKELWLSADPLILACVKEFVPAYREASHYSGLIPEAILGNPDHKTAQEIYADARKIIEKIEEQQAATMLAFCREKSHTSSALAEMLGAAFDGRVKYLFIAEDAEVWGSFDRARSLLSISDGPGGNREEILNLLAVQTLLHGGSVYTCPTGQLPDEKLAFAAFRY